MAHKNIFSNKFHEKEEEEERISLKMTYHYIFHISTRNVNVKWRHNLKCCMHVCMDNTKIEILEANEVRKKYVYIW